MEVRGPGGTLVFQIDNPDPGGRRAVELIVDGLPFKGRVVAFPTDGSTRRVDVRTSLRRVETGAT
jgi:hypothetical protein